MAVNAELFAHDSLQPECFVVGRCFFLFTSLHLDRKRKRLFRGEINDVFVSMNSSSQNVEFFSVVSKCLWPITFLFLSFSPFHKFHNGLKFSATPKCHLVFIHSRDLIVYTHKKQTIGYAI